MAEWNKRTLNFAFINLIRQYETIYRRCIYRQDIPRESCGSMLNGKWPEEALMKDIAAENNLSETAFIVKEGDYYRLRWFTPVSEIGLCGHATLASGFVVLNFYDKEADEVTFVTRSGKLTVKRKEGMYEMQFPNIPLEG